MKAIGFFRCALYGGLRITPPPGTPDLKILLYSSPRALIISPDTVLDHDAATGLGDGLGQHGWPCELAHSVIEARSLLAAFPIRVILLDMRLDPEAALEILRALDLKDMPNRALPVLGLGGARLALSLAQSGLADLERAGIDLIHDDAIHPLQAALRLEALDRCAVGDEEIALRRATFGESLPPAPAASDSPPAPLHILLVGEPGRRCLELHNALAAHGVQVCAAFTAYTAFDYLHDATFDAVVLWSGASHAEALSIAGGMRRNTRLYHIPTILALKPKVTVLTAEAFNRGLSDIVDADCPADLAAMRIIGLARRHRREAEQRRALDPAKRDGRMEAVTGLFTRDLFASHLAALAHAAPTRGRPLSVAVMRLADRPHTLRAKSMGWVEKAIPQMGSMISRLVRIEDTAARLASDVFAFAFPSATAEEARVAVERIAAVIGCTAFEADAENPPFTVDFDLGVAQLQPGESAAQALERAANSALSHAAVG